MFLYKLRNRVAGLFMLSIWILFPMFVIIFDYLMWNLFIATDESETKTLKWCTNNWLVTVKGWYEIMTHGE